MKKSIGYGVVIISIVGMTGYIFFGRGGAKEETLVVHPHDFVQQVSVSGKVVATQSVDLSFEQTGRVTGIRIAVGDRVSAGQVLASQDTAQLDAQLAEMQAGIDLQKAKLDQLLAGAAPEDIGISETVLANAQISVENAWQTLEDTRQNSIDTIQDAYTKSDDAVRGKADQLFNNPRSTNPQLNIASSNSQLENDVKSERWVIESMLNAWAIALAQTSSQSDLESAAALANTNLDQIKSFLDKMALIVNGLAANSNLSQTTIDKWKTDISGARVNINTAISNLSGAQSSIRTSEATLKTAQGNLQSAQDQLTLKKAPARDGDIAVYKAQVKQAEASAQNIIAQMGKKQIHSPINGVMTALNSKVGSIAGANEAVLSLISLDTLQIESYVPEKSIPFIKVGNQASVTLDAYGGEALFTAQVISIDPAETLRDGVSTYRVKLQFVDRDERIKSGMTANVLITTQKKSNTIAVPQGIIINKDGKKFVQVKEGAVVGDRKVETGSISSLGQIEITSGLADGDIVILKRAN